MFSFLNFQNIFWLPLLEKAYAKLYKGYTNLSMLKVEDIIMDMSGSYLERRKIQSYYNLSQ